jgi:hypothetical protein
MAKKASSTNGHDKGESISGYFRKVFAENPSLLDTRSNDELYARWLRDHPGDKEVSERVRQNLSNIKGVLRKQKRRKPGRPKGSTQSTQVAATPAEAPKKVIRGLDRLEEHIDDCLSYAKQLDREGLADVIILLRRARNEVVWKMGERGER